MAFRPKYLFSFFFFFGEHFKIRKKQSVASLRMVTSGAEFRCAPFIMYRKLAEGYI